MSSTRPYPVESTERLLMMPSTSITASLSPTSLSSTVTSSSLGPAEREYLILLLLPRLEMKWPTLKRALIARRTRRMMAKAIQPRPRRGAGALVGVISGGGGVTGGGAEGATG